MLDLSLETFDFIACIFNCFLFSKYYILIKIYYRKFRQLEWKKKETLFCYKITVECYMCLDVLHVHWYFLNCKKMFLCAHVFFCLKKHKWIVQDNMCGVLY